MHLGGVDVLVSGLFDKINLGLVHAARHLDASAAEGLRSALNTLHPSVRVFRDGARGGDW